jgi:Membrane protein involved in the export of O-antigen and teichoic acid
MGWSGQCVCLFAPNHRSGFIGPWANGSHKLYPSRWQCYAITNGRPFTLDGDGDRGHAYGDCVRLYYYARVADFFDQANFKNEVFCRENVSFAHMVKVFHFGKNIFLGSIVSMLLNPFNRVMVSRYIGVAALPIYDIAYTGGMHIRNLVEVALRSILPEISHAVAEKTDAAKAKIFSIQHQAWGFVFKFGLVVYALLFMLAPLLLHLWLRDSFVATMPEIFRIMLVGTYASLIGVPAFYLLMGMGCVRHTLYSHAIQALLNVILVVMVASITGQLTLHSVVSCTSVAMAVSTAYLIWQSKRSMRNLFAHQ